MLAHVHMKYVQTSFQDIGMNIYLFILKFLMKTIVQAAK